MATRRRKTTRRRNSSDAGIGEKLRDHKEALQSALHDAKMDLWSFDDAWDKQDWAWLYEAGYLTKAEANYMASARG